MKAMTVMANAVRIFSLALFLQYLTVAYEVSLWCKILASTTAIVWAVSLYVEKDLNNSIEDQAEEIIEESTEE